MQSDESSCEKLKRREPGEVVPLTATQRHWWNGIRRQGGRGARSIYSAMRLSGPLDVTRLERCLIELVRRHEALRTRLALVNGALVQQVDPPHRRLEILEREDVEGPDPEMAARRLGESFVAKQVDLTADFLFAAKLFRLSASDHVLVLALEHLITDAVSNVILRKELWTLYEQLGRGNVELADPSFQFGDYAVWQQRMHAAWLEQHGAYWDQHLRGAPATLLPGRSRSPQSGNARSVITIPLGKEASDRLREAARHQRTLLSLVVFAIYAATMSRWGAQHDLVIRFQSHARYQPEVQGIVGFLANCLHLRIEMDAQETFSSLIERVNRELRLAYQHDDAGRIPDLVPECRTELSFNWIPDGSLRAHGSLQTTPPLSVDAFALDAPVTSAQPHFATFYDTPDGVVAAAYYPAGEIADEAIAEFRRILTVFVRELPLRGQMPISSIVT